MLIAGILAFPAKTLHKIIAITTGFFFVQALNIVRIISLFYLGQWNYTVFEWFHLTCGLFSSCLMFWWYSPFIFSG